MDYKLSQKEIYFPVVTTLLNDFDGSSGVDLTDDVPNIQCAGLSSSINLEISTIFNPLGYIDYKGFPSSFSDDIIYIAKIESLIIQGPQFINILYSFRSISKAIPELVIDKNEKDPFLIEQRIEYNSNIINIIRPELKKIQELMYYVRDAISCIQQCITFLSSSERKQKSSSSEALFLSLLKLLDILLKLDNLKDMKVSILADFNRLKRATGTNLSIDALEEQKQLQNFLGCEDARKAKQYIIWTLRSELKKIRGYEDVLIDLLDLSIEYLDNQSYLTPDEKFRYRRVIPHLMILIDGDADDTKSQNVFNPRDYNKRIKLQAIQTILKSSPITPLLNDMAITLHYVVNKIPHYDATTMDKNWGETIDVKIVEKHNILVHWNFVKTSYTDFIARFTSLINIIVKNPFEKVLTDKSKELAMNIFDISLEGLHHLSSWSSLLQQIMAWKYTHPNSSDSTQEERNSENSNISEDLGPVQYEQVIKLNFSKDELTVFVDIISMIKSLSSIMGKEEHLVAPFVRFHIHHVIQQFVQGDILPVLHRIDKRKKPILSSILNIRSLAADWLNGIEPREDYKGYSRKHGHLEPKHNPRVVSTSATQLHLLRNSIRCLFQENSEIRQKASILGKSDLEKEDILLFEKFYKDSYFFPYVLNLSGSIREISNLGEFWFREFFLEVDKSIQFPIEMSFPWILTEHVIKNTSSSDLPMIEKILYILEIYNDAAQLSLYDICQQYLYDEVEAEANLVLDQLIFLMSDEIYSHYKNFTGSNMLEKSYKNKLESLKGFPHLSLNKKRFEIPMKQRHMQLLGRSINFSFLIGQHINNKISKDIDTAIKRFESSDMTGIIELNTLINLLRQTHDAVSESLIIDSFNDLLNENNGNFAPTCFRSRISSHMLRTLLVDLFPNFSYNSFTQRFVRSPIQIRPAKYSKPPKTSLIKLTYGIICYKAFEMAEKLTRGFFGRPHLEAYVALTGYSDLSMIIEGCFSNLSETLQDIGTYVEALKDGIPPCKLPKYMYRAGGCYAYFEGKLTPLLQYDDLKPEIFQNLREVGNTIAFIRDLSEVLDVTDQFHFMNLAPFLGITPEQDVIDINTTKNSPLFNIFANLQKNLSSKDLDIVALSSETFSSISTINSLHETSFHLISSLNKVSSSRSLFQLLLVKINEILKYYKFNESWNIENEKDYIEVENSKSFHCLWSAMFFLFNMNNNSVDVDIEDDEDNDDTLDENANTDQVSDMEEFGHGFAISGSAILHFLNQKDIFEATDFSSFVIKVDNFDKLSESNINPDVIKENSIPSTTTRRNSFGFASDNLKIETEEFIESAKTHLEVMKMFFSLYECQSNLNSSQNVDANLDNSDIVESVKNINYFHPPNE